MAVIFKLIKQYPLAIISYFLYGFLFFELLKVRYRFQIESQHMDAGNRLAFGEGVAYTALFTIFIGIVFILIALLNAAFRKGHRKFYLLLCLPILISTLAIIFIIGI